MPESEVKFYPVIAKLLLLLDGNPVVSYRASIFAKRSKLNPNDYDLLHRFVTEYKGTRCDFVEQRATDRLFRHRIGQYLARKCAKQERFEQRVFEPIVEISIDLRKATVRPTA